ncbi:uncharacterized protein F4807DRAFT_454291 [Annulohypoxylon truncatum]|uniref:uncharacterized protein n=1 Tax=Annulohypoxylon truncatum TaxID=327061 RepID=UPI002008DDCE|nr:uncharacterized protein F4807DRAFT_454291 [Annulohypoxylon truncatum]KAI1204917.1 hypothetical protein F4807DRAFT_454291 [Annulohypoxylon truncatum]
MADAFSYIPSRFAFTCRNCDRRFALWKGLCQHADARNHTPMQFDCRCCNTTSPSAEDRRAHEAKEHNHCADCNRGFQNANNLRMHMHSRTHRGAGLNCPFCKKGFTSATGLAHHLEGARCPAASGLDRDAVYRAVRSKDPDGVLAKKLLGWHGSPSYEAGPNSWNGDAWECYLCHRDFVSLKGLNSHLNSVALNHLESESCGFSRFEAVQNTVSDIVSGDRRLTFG